MKKFIVTVDWVVTKEFEVTAIDEYEAEKQVRDMDENAFEDGIAQWDTFEVLVRESE